MLTRLLRLIAAEGRADSAELAHRFGVSYALMEQMLDALDREGYLKRVTLPPSKACTQCPMRSGCLSGGSARLWTLSEKGARVLQS